MKLLKGVLLALLFSLLVGFAIGTVLRLRLERPIFYIGELSNDSKELQRFSSARTRENLSVSTGRSSFAAT